MLDATPAAPRPLLDEAGPTDASREAAGDAAEVDASAELAPGPRVYARTRFVSIRGKPNASADWIGYLSVGESARLASTEPVSHAGDGCGKTPGAKGNKFAFYAVEPRGFVCVDDVAATLDADDAVVVELRRHTPRAGSPWPYEYGVSKGFTPERTLPGVATPKWPPTMIDYHEELAAKNTVAWTEEVTSGGKAWLRRNDMSFAPKDAVEPYPHVEFHGVELGKDHRLPIAFVRGTPREQFTREGEHRFVKTSATWDRHVVLDLTGQKEEGPSGTLYYETREGPWAAKRDITVVEPEAKAPYTRPAEPGDRHRWLEVAALGGWLVAYEEATPVYATLISAGKLGAVKHVPHEPQPPATTPLGTYTIDTKLVTTTLVSGLDDGSDYIHAEVPYSQRFLGIYLLHQAYWHDQWGEGRSGGCVNLSPIDSEWLFRFTDPIVPEGWHAVRRVPGDGLPSSVVVLHP